MDELLDGLNQETLNNIRLKLKQGDIIQCAEKLGLHRMTVTNTLKGKQKNNEVVKYFIELIQERNQKAAKLNQLV